MSDSLRQFGGDKMFLHAANVAEWQAGRLPVPVTIEFNVTNSCNHHCGGCTFGHLVFKPGPKDSIPFDTAKRIIAELADLGVRALTFSGGGEPLVYGEAKVLELMELARTGGMDVALITNGSLLRSERFLDLCEWVRVSLDAYDEDTFERFHGRSPGEFAKVMRNVRAFGAAALQRKMKRHRCATFGVGFLTDHGSPVIDGEGRGDLHRMAEFCAGIAGLDYLQFRPLVRNMVDDPELTGGWGGETNDAILMATTAQAESAAHRYGRSDFKVLSSAGKYDALRQPGFGKTYDCCHAHFLEAVVAADAKVYLCCHRQGMEDSCLGDLTEQSFAAVWHSERAKQVAASFNPQTACPPACRLHQQNSALQELKMQVHRNFI